MPENTGQAEYPNINTFTPASARRLSDDDLTFPEMYPHEVASCFGSDITNGLSVKQVKRLRSKYGENLISGEVPVGFAHSLKRQIKNLVPVFLFFSCILFYIFRGGGEYIATAAGILALTLINAALEHKVGKVFEKVSKLSSPRATVIREGKTFVTDSRALVPGDIIVLESDNIVPADARLIECSSFTVLETPVSGKPNAVQKDARFLSPSKDVKVYENMVYAGTIVTGGNATAVVCATGKDVLLNRHVKKGIASRLPAYLKTVLKTGRIISVGVVASQLILLFAGIISGANITDTFIIALGVGTASLCDTAFALATAATAKGISDTLKGGGVFRNLDSFEKIAETDTIMCGKHTAFPPKTITLESCYDNSDVFEYNRQNKAKAQDIIRCLLLCSSIREKFKDPKAKKKKTDDEIYEASPFTLALLKAVGETGYTLEEARNNFFRIETEYDSFGEMCRVLGLIDGKPCVILRGSPENVLSRCVGYRKDGKNYRIDDKAKEKILSAAFDMSKTMIPIAVAMGYTTADTLKDIMAERKLIFLGFAGFYTSLEIKTASAVFKCSQAGISTLVFSDDSYYNSLNMAKNAGVISGEDEICTREILHETEEGLFIANSDKYKLFTGLNDDELLYILKLRNQNKHKVAFTASKIEQARLIKEANSSFVSANTANDALLNACDVQLTKGSFDGVVEAIKQSKLVTKRIADTCHFMTAGFLTLFFWMFFSLLIYGEIPFGLRDVLIFGMLINTVFGFSLAFTPSFSPENRKILADRNHEVSYLSLSKGILISLVYSVFGGLLCIFSGKLTAAGGMSRVSVSVITYSAVLFLFSLMTGKSRSIFTNKFYRNYNSVIAFVLGLGSTLCLTCVPAVSKFFGFETVKITDALVAFSVAFVYFLFIQLVFLGFEIKSKRKLKRKDSQITLE